MVTDGWPAVLPFGEGVSKGGQEGSTRLWLRKPWQVVELELEKWQGKAAARERGVPYFFLAWESGANESDWRVERARAYCEVEVKGCYHFGPEAVLNEHGPEARMWLNAKCRSDPSVISGFFC